MSRGFRILNKFTRGFSGPRATAFKNRLNRLSDEGTARDQEVGENHIPLVLKNKKIGFANYAGPSTRIIKRLKRGDPPRTAVDKVAKAHDIRYTLAENVNDVRDADNKLIRKTKEIKKNKLDSKFNANLVLRGIQAKLLGERAGVIKRGAFAGFAKVPKEDRELLNKELGKLEQEGFGAYPAYDLKRQLIRANKPKRSKILDNLVYRLIPDIAGGRRLSDRSSRILRGKLKKKMKGQGIGTAAAISIASMILPPLIKLGVKGIKKLIKRRKKKKGKGPPDELTKMIMHVLEGRYDEEHIRSLVDMMK